MTTNIESETTEQLIERARCWADVTEHPAVSKLIDKLAAALSQREEVIQRLRIALERIAHHDGDRWDWDTRELGDVFGVSVERKPSPQEIAQEALSATGGETEQ